MKQFKDYFSSKPKVKPEIGWQLAVNHMLNDLAQALEKEQKKVKSLEANVAEHERQLGGLQEAKQWMKVVLKSQGNQIDFIMENTAPMPDSRFKHPTLKELYVKKS